MGTIITLYQTWLTRSLEVLLLHIEQILQAAHAQFLQVGQQDIHSVAESTLLQELLHLLHAAVRTLRELFLYQ